MLTRFKITKPCRLLCSWLELVCFFRFISGSEGLRPPNNILIIGCMALSSSLESPEEGIGDELLEVCFL